MEKKNNHGGVRKGSGRKAFLRNPIKFLVALEKEQVEILDEQIDLFRKQGIDKTKAQIVRDLISGLRTSIAYIPS